MPDIDLPLSEDCIAVNPAVFGGKVTPSTSIASTCHSNESSTGNKALKQTEAEFQKEVIDWLHKHDWRVAHFRPAKTSKGWRTAVGADGAGFPDLCCVNAKSGRVMFIELKSDTGKVSLEQAEWLLALGKCPGVEVHVLKPSSDVEGIL